MEMDIFKNLDLSISKKFLEGNIVFIIYENDKIKGMVVSKEDFEKKIQYHQYNPLIFIVPLHVKIAYIYGCLNHEFKKPKDKTYKIMWREVKTDDWNLWFIVKSYTDDIYLE